MSSFAAKLTTGLRPVSHETMLHWRNGLNAANGRQTFDFASNTSLKSMLVFEAKLKASGHALWSFRATLSPFGLRLNTNRYSDTDQEDASTNKFSRLSHVLPLMLAFRTP